VVKRIVFFLIHQFVGTWGVAIAAAVFAYTSIGLLHLLGLNVLGSRNANWLLTELPYFPVQIGVALWSGFYLSRRFHHASMLWVWVLPFTVLWYAVLNVPSLTPDQIPLAFQAGAGQSKLTHYFGSGCNPSNRCVDQVLVTMPFFTSVCYSMGALLARSLTRQTRLAGDHS